MRWVGESSSGRLAPAPAPVGHVVPPDPAPAVCWFYARERSGRTRGGPGPLWGSAPSAVGSELPSSGTRGVTGPVPEQGAGPGPLAAARGSRRRRELSKAVDGGGAVL